MKLSELFGDLAGGFGEVEFPSHLATDSRDVVEGGAFVALEGEKTDGHKYIPQAIANGASLIIVRSGKAPEGVNVPVIELENPERDLAEIASRKLQAHNLQEVIAITGSVGKTTTRAALQKVWHRTSGFTLPNAASTHSLGVLQRLWQCRLRRRF